ncbi:glycosyltransferase family 4 protein [Candidatus Woesearchaeota archaeon]|nr:glycosyltransferase family 4 protein [Candidatus Woesearchaeota archaeon]
MKVLMLTSSYPIKGSNLGPFVQNIVKGLVKNGIKVGVMIFSTSKKYKEYKQDGATIYEYPYAKVFPPSLHKYHGLIPSVKSSFIAKIQVPGYFLSTIRYLKKISKNYDIIHAHWYVPSGLIACLAKSSIKKPVITTAWGAEFHLPKNKTIKNILAYVNKKSDSKIAVSRYMKSKAKGYGLDTKDMKVIPNCIDIKQFSLKRKKSDKVIIATIRRLVPEKRIQDLIKAVGLLPEDLKKKISLWVVGDGPEKENLMNLTKELGLSRITKFCGMVPHKRIPGLLSRIDIYANPSIQEGMATANLEAMAAGACVIATRGVGNDEVIIDGKNGFLYPAKDTGKLSVILSSLIKSRDLLQNTRKKSQKQVAHFSPQLICSEYINCYKKLLSH